uniref:Uncharacterized protein n=1 Tax=Vitis vinifera TaxID=29760 RepID=A5BC70_VITVI|nr:hypothetical protein VITISV_026109 [Vitis vinifera]
MGGNGSGESQVSDETSCPGILNCRSRMLSRCRDPPLDDTEHASLSGSTPSGFPKREAHGTCEHHTSDDSIPYPDMLSISLTKVSKPCYFIPKSCHSPRSAALQWCVWTPYPDIFAIDSKELSSISDCFGDQIAIKTPKLNTI